MKYNFFFIPLNLLGIILFFVAAILCKDGMLSQLFTSVSLIISLITTRFGAGKDLNIHYKHDEKTGI